MKTLTFIRMMMIGVSILIFLPFVAEAAAPIPHHMQKFVMGSGMHEGRAGVQPFRAFRQVVRIANAPWLRLHFSDHNLGEKSFITITSLKDGARQRLDATSLKQWQNKSAFFNGDAVEVELQVSPEDAGVFFEIGEVIVGERGNDFGDAAEVTESLPKGRLEAEAECPCSQDDRIASTDPAIGRIIPDGRTAWIASNGVHVTSGNGLDSTQFAGLQILEFNVPQSDSDGTINHPPPEHQYLIDADTIIFKDGRNLINSFAVFDCLPNSETGLLPVHEQRAFYRVTTRRRGEVTIRITGFGVDGPPPSFRVPGNSDNRVQQTATGKTSLDDTLGIQHANHSVTVDAFAGSQGSPMIIDDGSELVAGIHSFAGCSCPGLPQEGIGVLIKWDPLAQALQRFPGENVVYVDKEYPVPVKRDGTVAKPFDTLIEASGAVPAGGIVSIVAGSYNETLTISKSMTLTAPVGSVVIGD